MWCCGSGKEIDDGLQLVGVTVIVVDGELQTLRKAVGEVLGGVVENVCRVLMEGPRNINTAVGIVAGFLPAVAVCGDVGLAVVKIGPVGRTAGKIVAVVEISVVSNSELSFRCVVGPEVRCGGETVAGHALADGLQDVALQGLIRCGGGGAEIINNRLLRADFDAATLGVESIVGNALFSRNGHFYNHLSCSILIIARRSVGVQEKMCGI